MILANVYELLPTVNAGLNALAFSFLVAALVAVKRGRVDLHKRLVLTAATLSLLFLICYLVYHFEVGSVRFRKEGWIRVVYFTVLISHTVLAVVQVPLILATLWLGLKDRRAAHRRLARITAPIWLYVSSTGVVIYLMLYRM